MDVINNFWNHFEQNNFVFLFMNEIPVEELKTHFNNLNYILQQFNKDLNVVIGNKKNQAELIITANGNPYLFKDVELLVHHAPVIERWKITAFIQPQSNIISYQQGTDNPFEFNGIKLRISEIYFQPIKNPKKPTDFGIKVFLKNYIIHKNNPNLKDAVYTVIEHLIGEKSFANDIAFIEIGQLNSYDDLIELYHLNRKQ